MDPQETATFRGLVDASRQGDDYLMLVDLEKEYGHDEVRAHIRILRKHELVMLSGTSERTKVRLTDKGWNVARLV